MYREKVRHKGAAMERCEEGQERHKELRDTGPRSNSEMRPEDYLLKK